MIKNVFTFIFLLTAISFSGKNIKKIWEGTIVKDKSVTLESYIPKSGSYHKAVIVCPGGSYFWLDYEIEGIAVAKWLQKNGIAAFVLKYRTAGVGAFVTYYRSISGGNKYPNQIMDLQRAIQLLRENYEELNINPDAVGIMGFSAGGHLAMSSAIYHNTNFMKDIGIEPIVSLRPNFVVPVYPVVSMQKPYVHKRSLRGLLTTKKSLNNKNMRDSLSLENKINGDCPPVFLVNCKDDPIVDYRNSTLLDSALTKSNVMHKYILYNTGGHGFGASEIKGTDECRQWKQEFLNWLNNFTFLTYESRH